MPGVRNVSQLSCDMTLKNFWSASIEALDMNLKFWSEILNLIQFYFLDFELTK